LKEYIRGNIIRFVALFKDASGASIIPTSPAFYTYDPYGSLVVSATPTSASGDGRYVYNLVTATNWNLGTYRSEFRGIVSSGTVSHSVFWKLLAGDVNT